MSNDAITARVIAVNDALAPQFAAAFRASPKLRADFLERLRSGRWTLRDLMAAPLIALSAVPEAWGFTATEAAEIQVLFTAAEAALNAVNN
mgnify:CR=1 FL=1